MSIPKGFKHSNKTKEKMKQSWAKRPKTPIDELLLRKKERSKNWRVNNSDYFKQYNKEYRIKNPHKNKENHLKLKFGMTLEDYNNRLISQSHKCAICYIDEVTNQKALAVDHCHTTGKIRGLLCDSCNLGLGIFKDNQELLLKAIMYLKKNE